VALLRDDLDLLTVAIDQVSAKTGIPRDHIEKDFWLTECLRGLVLYGTEHLLSIMFKGGTSLSKAYKLIRRFSEDADMVVVFPELSTSARDKHLKGFMAAAEVATGLTAVNDASVSDSGKTRVATLEYPGGSATPMVDTRVKIELHTIGGVSPHSAVELGSMLSEHWDEIVNAPPASDYDELASFHIKVVAPCRTLVEKLVILHEAHTRDGGTAVHRKQATVRHYYDVWCLLGDEAILTELRSEDVGVLARSVATYSQAAEYRTAARPARGFAASPAFQTPPTRAVLNAYNATMLRFVWPGAPSPTLEECIARVGELKSNL
jgi:hypothetical protein